MNPTNIDITGNEPLNVTPMMPEEAQECDAAIHQHLETANKHLDSAGALLATMKRREGWKALGFGTWTEYLESRAAAGKSRRRALKLLQAEEVKQNLAMCGISHMDIPTVTSQLTTLAQLSLEQQAEGLQKANELALAEGKRRTADHVAKAVKKINCIEQKTEVKEKALGLPMRGDSTLPESDRINDLTHASPANVDDRPGLPPTSPKLYKNESELAKTDKGAVATSVQLTLPEILINDYEPDYKKQAPADLREVVSASDIDALIDLHGSSVVCRMFVAASPELQQIIRGYYPGIGALVTSELGGSVLNTIAKHAGFLPNHEPDAVRVDMLLQENARLDEALRLCEEGVQRLERQNSELHRKLESQQSEIVRLKAKLAVLK